MALDPCHPSMAHMLRSGDTRRGDEPLESGAGALSLDIRICRILNLKKLQHLGHEIETAKEHKVTRNY